MCGGTVIKYGVSIERLENGQWVRVAQGVGTAYYKCNGTALNYYIAESPEFQYACG
jgi:hypothetical protein